MIQDKELEAAVRGKNIQFIRAALWTYACDDPRMQGSFRDALDYVLTHGISQEDLYESDNGKTMPHEATEENLKALFGNWRANFSKQKMEAVRRMAMLLVPSSPRPTDTDTTNHFTAGEVPFQRGRYDAGREPRPANKAAKRRLAATVAGAAVLVAYILYKLCK